MGGCRLGVNLFGGEADRVLIFKEVDDLAIDAAADCQVKVAIPIGVPPGRSKVVADIYADILDGESITALVVVNAVDILSLAPARDVKGSIVGGSEIEVAIIVGVAPGKAGGVGGVGENILRGENAGASTLHTALVDIEEVGLAIAAHGEVEVAVAIRVAPGDAGGERDGPQVLGNELAWGSTLYAALVDVKLGDLAAETNESTDIPLEGVAALGIAEGQVEVAVAVGVAPGRAGGVADEGAQVLGDEVARGSALSAALVDVKLAGLVVAAGDQIEVAIAIGVAPGDAGDRAA